MSDVHCFLPWSDKLCLHRSGRIALDSGLHVVLSTSCQKSMSDVNLSCEFPEVQRFQRPLVEMVTWVWASADATTCSSFCKSFVLELKHGRPVRIQSFHPGKRDLGSPLFMRQQCRNYVHVRILQKERGHSWNRVRWQFRRPRGVLILRLRIGRNLDAEFQRLNVAAFGLLLNWNMLL
jgi:hypothetical protein